MSKSFWGYVSIALVCVAALVVLNIWGKPDAALSNALFTLLGTAGGGLWQLRLSNKPDPAVSPE